MIWTTAKSDPHGAQLQQFSHVLIASVRHTRIKKKCHSVGKPTKPIHRFKSKAGSRKTVELVRAASTMQHDLDGQGEPIVICFKAKAVSDTLQSCSMVIADHTQRVPKSPTEDCKAVCRSLQASARDRSRTNRRRQRRVVSLSKLWGNDLAGPGRPTSGVQLRALK